MAAIERADGTIATALLLLGGSLAAFVGLLVYRQKRKRGYRALGQRLGLSYTYRRRRKGRDMPILAGADRWRTTARHFLQGSIGDIDIGITDAEALEPRISDDRDRRTHANTQHYDLGSCNFTTTVALRSPTLDLPIFDITPRDEAADAMKGDFGIRDFDDPHFVHNNKVEGPEAERITQALSVKIRDLLRENRTVSIGGSRDVIVLFHHMRVMSFEEIEATVRLGRQLVAALGDPKR